jgi:hypothetical protein
MQVILFGLPCAMVLIPWFAFGNPLPVAVLAILALTSPGQEFLRPFAESLAAAVLSIFIPRRHQERDGGGRGRKSASKKVRSRLGLSSTGLPSLGHVFVNPKTVLDTRQS